jgi:hypothetical protein
VAGHAALPQIKSSDSSYFENFPLVEVEISISRQLPKSQKRKQKKTPLRNVQVFHRKDVD